MNYLDLNSLNIGDEVGYHTGGNSAQAVEWHTLRVVAKNKVHVTTKRESDGTLWKWSLKTGVRQGDTSSRFYQMELVSMDELRRHNAYVVKRKDRQARERAFGEIKVRELTDEQLNAILEIVKKDSE